MPFIAILALSIMIARSLAQLSYKWWWTGISARAEAELGDRVLRSYAMAPYEMHLGRDSTDLLTRAIAHVNLACSSGLNGLVAACSDGMLSLALGFVIIAADPLSGLGVITYFALIAGGYVLLSRKLLTSLAERVAARVSGLYQAGAILLRGIREMTLYGARDDYLRRVSDVRADMLSAQRTTTALSDVPRAALEVALYGAILVVLAVLLAQENSKDVLALIALYVLAALRVMPALARALGSANAARIGIRIGQKLTSELASMHDTFRLSKTSLDQ